MALKLLVKKNESKFTYFLNLFFGYKRPHSSARLTASVKRSVSVWTKSSGKILCRKGFDFCEMCRGVCVESVSSVFVPVELPLRAELC